ncbi:MAG: hypothetical protein AB1486_09125 [Planctomycetota bacterium]
MRCNALCGLLVAASSAGIGAYLAPHAVPVGLAAHAPSPRTALLVGFRPVLEGLIWMHLYGRHAEGDHASVLSDATFLLELEPDRAANRDFLAYWLAFLVARSEPDPEHRADWMARGIAIWQEGLQIDPLSARLHLGLGSTLWVRRDDARFCRRIQPLLGCSVLEAAWTHLEVALETNPSLVLPILFGLALDSWSDTAVSHRLLARCLAVVKRREASGEEASPVEKSMREVLPRYAELARMESELAALAATDPAREMLLERCLALRDWLEGEENPFRVPPAAKGGADSGVSPSDR